MADKLAVIAEIVPGGSGFHVVDAKNVAYKGDDLSKYLASNEEEVGDKADKEYVDTELAKKANASDFNAYKTSNNAEVAKKANTSDVNTELGKKLNTSDFNTYKSVNDAAVAGKVNKSYVDTELAKKANTSDLAGKANASDVAALQTAVNNKADGTTVSALAGRVSTNETNIAAANARIDGIVAIPPGSTEGNTELIDIRTGSDGKNYATAGDAVRQQITDLKSDLSQSNSTLKAFGFYDIENLYNKYASGIEVGGYYGGNDGKWVSWNNYAETDYYRISKNDKFYLSRNNNGTIEHPASISTCFYDSNKNFICGIGDSANGIYTVPNRDNIYYARTAYATDKTEFMIVKGDKIPSKYRYVPFIPETSEIVNVPEKILDFNKTLIDAGFVSRISPNLFDKDAKGIEVGGYYGGNDGKWVEWAGFAETDYYRINPSDKFYLSRKNGDAVENPAALSTCFYDINKNFICGIGESKNGIYTVPRNANIYYARTAYSTTKPEFMIIKGSEIPSSYTYYPYSDETKNENINAVFAKLQDNQWYGKKWYAYGTSLTNTANEGKYAKYVEQFSGMIRVNKGNSGGGIVTNTINKQAIMNITDGKLEADLITFEVGANDTSAVIGDIYDTSDNTFCGALNQCIRYLQANTNAQIVVISSPNSRYQYPNPDDKLPPETKFGTDNHTKYDQWKAIREVCAINSCYYIPMGEGANMSYARMNASDLYNVDQIHHTELGGYNLGKFVWHQLKNIPNWYASMPT